MLFWGFFLPTWHSQYFLHLIQPSLQIPLQICQEGSSHHLLARRKSHTRVTILLFLLTACFLISVRDHFYHSILCAPCQAIHIHISFNLISQNNPCSSSEISSCFSPTSWSPALLQEAVQNRALYCSNVKMRKYSMFSLPHPTHH